MNNNAFNKALKGALIHVGVRKAASTYLQSWFANHKGVTFSPAKTILEHCVAIASESNVNRKLPTITPPAKYEEGMRAVISNEHFCFFADHRHTNLSNKTFHDKLLRTSAEVLSTICPDGKVLIVTRAAPFWIKSAYRHHVLRTYFPWPFPTFVRRIWDHLHATLNYEKIASTYRHAFSPERVKLIPIELLKDDPERFSDEVCSFAGIDATSGFHESFHDRPKNVSMSSEHVEKWRKVQQFIRIMHRESPRPKNINAFQKTVLRGESFERFLFDFTVAFTYDTNPQVQRVVRMFLDHLPPPPPSRMDWSLKPDQFKKMTEGATFLKNEPLYKTYIDQYVANEELPA